MRQTELIRRFFCEILLKITVKKRCETYLARTINVWKIKNFFFFYFLRLALLKKLWYTHYIQNYLQLMLVWLELSWGVFFLYLKAIKLVKLSITNKTHLKIASKVSAENEDLGW